MGEARTAILADPALRNLKPKPRRTVTKPAIVAGAAILALGGLFLADDGPMRLEADALSDASEMPILKLADGSTIQLNADSAVAYDFSAARRTVRLLRGEAFFQVAKDPTRPFVVEAQGGRTTAVGTAFDVRVDDDTTDVTVTEHAVSLTSDDPVQSATRLNEGEQAAYGADGRVRQVRSVDTDAVLAWRRGQLVVDNATLREVVAEIGRHFSGRILIASSLLGDRRVSGTITITDTDAALGFLEKSLGVTATRIGPLIILRG